VNPPPELVRELGQLQHRLETYLEHWRELPELLNADDDQDPEGDR
jgi:hypothetical protein